jgi:hypothetical protein
MVLVMKCWGENLPCCSTHEQGWFVCDDSVLVMLVLMVMCVPGDGGVLGVDGWGAVVLMVGRQWL